MQQFIRGNFLLNRLRIKNEVLNIFSTRNFGSFHATSLQMFCSAYEVVLLLAALKKVPKVPVCDATEDEVRYNS